MRSTLYKSALKQGFWAVTFFALGEALAKLVMGFGWTTSGGIVLGAISAILGMFFLNIEHMPSRRGELNVAKHLALGTLAPVMGFK